MRKVMLHAKARGDARAVTTRWGRTLLLHKKGEAELCSPEELAALREDYPSLIQEVGEATAAAEPVTEETKADGD